MIQLSFQPQPAELTPAVITALTDEFKASGTDVWNKFYIKKALLLMSNSKCCYCECKLDEESKYLEVEHFFPKGSYPDQVVLWENLLPSCKHCNGCKGEHDTQAEPIIHPVRDTISQHLRLNLYRFYPRNASVLGRKTIDATNLNDRERLANPRYKIGTAIKEKLEDLLDQLLTYLSNPSTRQRNKVTTTLKNLMLEGSAEYEYSATAATVVLTDEHYPEIKNLFQQHSLWNGDFDLLEQELLRNSLA